MLSSKEESKVPDENKKKKKHETYTVVRTLGAGAFGTAHLVKADGTGEDAVIK